MSKYPEPSPAFTAITDFMDSQGYAYASYPDEQRIGFTMGTKLADYRFKILISHGGDFIRCFDSCPFRVKPELRSSVAELIARANFGMTTGSFELDMSDGEVRFHVSHLIAEAVLSTDTVERLYRCCCSMLDRYFPAFMQHIHAGYTPEDAVFHAELDYHAKRIPDEPKPPKPDNPRSVAPPKVPRRHSVKKPNRSKGDMWQGELPL